MSGNQLIRFSGSKKYRDKVVFIFVYKDLERSESCLSVMRKINYSHLIEFEQLWKKFKRLRKKVFRNKDFLFWRMDGGLNELPNFNFDDLPLVLLMRSGRFVKKNIRNLNKKKLLALIKGSGNDHIKDSSPSAISSDQSFPEE